MGQNSSRYQESSQPAAPSNSTPTTAVADINDDQPDSPSDVGADTPNPTGSRQTSFRKNILKFVKPSSIRNRVNSIASNSGEVKRSWRNSRRWSKAQPVLPDSLPSSPSDNSIAGPSALPPSASNKGKQRENNSTLEEDEEYHDNKASSMAPTPQFPISVLPDRDLFESPNAEASLTTDDSLEVDLHPVENSTNPAIHLSEFGPDAPNHGGTSVIDREQNEYASLPEPQVPTQQQQQPTPQPPRQFPPPGTLVVVQGIVHTTDVSRTAASASPATSATDTIQSNSNSRSASTPDSSAEQGTSRARNRLSALLRPRSLSSRPTSTITNDPPSTATIPSQESDSPTLSDLESPTTSTESSQTRVTTPANEPVHLPQDQPSSNEQVSSTIDNHPPAISSSSIDVLGTLLSVAAAATAASLLTGSSEPILSSGLAPANASTPSQMPTSTPSTTSLPNLPYPRADAALPDISAAGRAERMREAWGTIRQRLGLRPSTVPPDGAANSHLDSRGQDAASNGQNSEGPELGSLTDTRELMLAEMARAFNIGLGLNGLGGLAPGSNNEVNATPGESITLAEGASPELPVPSGTATNAVTMPPEGSFERFLVDLQIDLRIALTQEQGESDGEEQQLPTSTHQAPDDNYIAANTSEVPFAVASPSSTTEVHSRQAQAQESEASNALSSELQQPNEDISDMPSLQDVSDSESESESDEEDREDQNYEEDDFQSAAEHGSMPDQGYDGPSDRNRPPTSGTGRIDASGRINWWRLYRFPPIISPRVDAPGSRPPLFPGNAPPASSPMSTVNPAANPVFGPSETISSEPPLSDPHALSNQPVSSASSIPASMSTPTGGNVPSQMPLHSVVPVIVVGLQSVNSEWRPDIPLPSESEGIDFFGQPASENHAGGSDNGEDDDLDGWGGQRHNAVEPIGSGTDGARGRGRARGWHSRAANAIRNLRTSRRNAEVPLGTQTSMVAPGSRTFLIYVIGGYYPPDHSIVTGGPNILDSFEALLELADLLGQVKPATASKDDIEKSGLEIIKASELAQHEQAGKISSNCTDRCLICLDDYEPEDQIRVMSCRHAFHKGCVDEWLHRGRNNCPACRSTGVNTDSHPTTSPFS